MRGWLEKVRPLLEHAGFRRYAANTGWMMGERVLRLLAGVFVYVWVARYLGPADFGRLNYAQSIVVLLGPIASLGLDSVVFKRLVNAEEESMVLLASSFFMKMIGSLCLLVFAVLLAFALDAEEGVDSLMMVIAVGAVFQTFNVLEFYYQARTQGRTVAIVNTAALMIGSIARISFILLKLPLIWFGLSIAFDSLLIAFFYLLVVRVDRPFKRPSTEALINPALMRSLLKEALPLMLSSFVILVYLRIDQIMIQSMIGSSAVGEYAAAARISEAWYFVPMVIGTSLFPAILRARSISDQLYRLRLRRLYALMAWLGIIVGIVITFSSGWLVPALFGKDYTSAIRVLTIHVWAGMFVSLGVAGGRWLLAEGLQLYSAVNTTIGALLNVLLNFAWIPSMGIEGAAWATLVSYAVASFLAMGLFSRTRGNFRLMTGSLLGIGVFSAKDDQRKVD